MLRKATSTTLRWAALRPCGAVRSFAGVSDDSASSTQWLDSHQYKKEGILRYERVFGRGFVSPGGKETTEATIKLLNLKAGETVLDIGSGLGGAACLMGKQGAKVLGLELSANMLEEAEARKAELLGEGASGSVDYQLANALTVQLEEESFDVVFSRDSFIHVEDKHTLFQNVLEWMRPGGRLVFTDYCCSHPEMHSAEFKAYLKDRQYHLIPVDEYQRMLEEVGFMNVDAKDTTSELIRIMEAELSRAQSERAELFQDFTTQEVDEVLASWEAKIKRAKSGEHRWGQFMATIPE